MLLEASAVHRTVRIGALLLLAVLACTVAHADVTPPDAVDTCTLDAQKHPGEECLMCTAWQGDSAKCLKRLSSKGYEQRCRGAGTATWSEVWCRRPAKR